MKKFLLLIMASLMTVSMMAIGTGDGSTQANAIDYDWDNGIIHNAGGTQPGALWYRVDLAPMYEEENPSFTLYLVNPSNKVGTSVKVSMHAKIAGQEVSKEYTIGARQTKSTTGNAGALARMHQTEIYLTLQSTGEIRLNAKVVESTDLDETCKDARVLTWNTEATQNPTYSAWWKVDLKPIKDVEGFDALITLKNTGSKKVNLKIGQSLDCPASGLTKREYTLAAGESIQKKVPRDMIASVLTDELYFGVENVESPVSIKVEKVAQPVVPVINPDENFVDLHVTDTIKPLPGKTFYRIKVSEMNSQAKYEPEFTYRNESSVNAKVSVKMAFGVPAFSTSDAEYNLAPDAEEIVVYKKNMLEGLEGVEYIYLLTEVEGSVNFYGRFKHVREGKACKTNIDLNWGEPGHTQDARTTQWYAVNVADARDNTQDIVVHLKNLGTSAANVKASLAFSCPYIDLQEVSHTIAAGKEEVRTLRYSSYAMMSDTVWIGLETSQDLKFWATTKPAQTKEPDKACEQAESFDWDNGVFQKKDTTVWYKINMEEVREKAAKFPTVFVENLSATNEVKITAELSLECPDSIENQSRSLTIPAKGTYSKQIARNLFENIVQPEIYLRVTTTENISLQVRLTEEAAGSSCSSAIPFNWASGNTQAANANLWYMVDLHSVIETGNDLRLHMQNRDNAKCEGFIQLAYSCPLEETTSYQNFTLAPNAEKAVTIRNSALEAMTDGVVYVNLSGSTGLRFWADKLDVEPFDPITGEGITLTELKWNTLYTQTADTAWYLIPKSEIEYVKGLEEKVKPVAHLIDASSSAKTIFAEAAFAFPIVKKMMGKAQELKVNQHFADTVPAGTFDQVLKHDSIIVRIIRTKGTGAFQFKAELVKAFNGNSPKDALPVRLNALYTQAPNTEMWYKVKTADLKKDKNLFNKVLFVRGANVGKGDAKVKVAVFDGYKPKYTTDDDLLMDRGEKTIKKGQGKSHNVPAQAIYGVGDVELYIKLRTTDSLVFETKFNGEYAAQDPDPKQQEAKLVVPNVEYTLPGDNQPHWYRVCLPYIQNNYKYVDASRLAYELNGTATVEVTATFQDEMNCAMPVRKRTINKSGKTYNGSKPLRELIEKGIKKAGYTFDLSSTAPDFIDSMLHRFVTKDSVTLYVRVKSDKEMKAKLITPQTTGDDCLNAMSFDWEHGNVNPKNLLGSPDSWYVAALDTAKLYQENKGLRLHIDNWSDKADAVSASLYFKCGDPSQGDITRTIPADSSMTKDISLDFIKASSPQLMFIQFRSSEDTHIWIEKVDVKRDTVYSDTTFFVCKGASVLGKTINVDTVWSDTIRNIKSETKLAMYDSISTVKAFVLREPKVYDFSAQLNIKRGATLDLTAADTWVKAQYAADDNDTIQNIASIKWQYAIYNAGAPSYVDVDLTNQPKLSAERINVKYIATTECDNTLDIFAKNGTRDTLFKDTCNFYRWAANDSLYIESTDKNPDYVVFPGGANWADSTSYLSLKLTNPSLFNLVAVSMYGNRLLSLNRNQINSIPGWENALDSIYDPTKEDVKWYKMKGATPDPDADAPAYGEGYYINEPDGSPLVGTFYAIVKIGSTGPCGNYGRTQLLVCKPSNGAAPKLAPNIVMPGEDIKVLNLDPEKETTIRIFTTEGLIQRTYTARGEETFTIKAANDHGFYLVELTSGDEKSTLRYIVK